MKALFSRLHRSSAKEKDVQSKDKDRDRINLNSNAPPIVPTTAVTTTNEKVVDPTAFGPPTTAIISPDSSHDPASNRSSNRQSRGPSQVVLNRISEAGSGSRPPSQFELSLQKPLPELSTAKLPLPPPREEEEEATTQGQAIPRNKQQEQRAREPSQSTTATSSRATAHDSHGRSTTLSKSTHFNSVSTDNTSVSGIATPPATGGGSQQPPPAGATKKVAFISPPPTPGGLSITAPLPSDYASDLNSLTDLSGTQQQQESSSRSASGSHAHSHSLSKATSLPNAGAGTSGAGPGGSNVVATGSTTNLSLRNGRVSSMSQAPPSSTKNTPSKNSSSSTRAATSPAAAATTRAPRASSRADFASSVLSLRSAAGTPYSHMSGKSAIQMPASWSEAAEEDLVSNLGPRERTRQEVLWEIVASEQRYVAELIKLRETFIDPLLHPYATSPITSTTHLGGLPEDFLYRSISPTESVDRLPIASRFLGSPTPGSGPKPVKDNVAGIGAGGTMMADAQSIDESDEAGGGGVGGDGTGEASDKIGKPYYLGLKGMMKNRHKAVAAAASTPPRGQSPYRGMGSKTPTQSRARTAPASGATSRQSLIMDNSNSRSGAGTPTLRGTTPYGQTAASRKLHKPAPGGDGPDGMLLPPHLLPEDLRVCLEVLEGPTLKGHITLCESLRKRYDEQYPLVRSLADVFVANSHILKGYATYVLHLERALEQVDSALQSEVKKKPKNQDAADWAKVCTVFKHLEENAADKGETGLAISLSKPFQRLLKYPLMFQNLLFHTDPSTYEYESTLQMVAEVERIVRSIEDEKIQKEERDQTRDVFARIEGLEKVKMLAIPKPSRVLVEEKVYFGEDLTAPGSVEGNSRTPSVSSPLANGSSPNVNAKNVKQKSSLKRLSDVLPGAANKSGVGGKNDLWLVKFNDVVLRCQRTGITSLPLATGVNNGPGVSSNGVAGRSNSLPDFTGQGKGKYATTGRRHTQARPRNLYKFIKIETWVIGTVAKPRAGMVSMEDIGRSRSGVVAIEPVKSGDTDDEANDSDESDRKSKMSFSYWGADKITVDPVASAKARAAAVKSANKKGSPLAPAPYHRAESTARAKFGNRLRGADEDDGPVSIRAGAARRGAGTSSQSAARRAAAATDDSVSSNRRAVATNSRTSGVASPSSVGPARRIHNQSTTSNASAIVSRAKIVSTTPSLTASDWIDPSVHRL